MREDGVVHLPEDARLEGFGRALQEADGLPVLVDQLVEDLEDQEAHGLGELGKVLGVRLVDPLERGDPPVVERDHEVLAKEEVELRAHQLAVVEASWRKPRSGRDKLTIGQQCE